MKKISILGSTGSIGIQTLEVIQSLPDQFKVLGLCCDTNISLLKKQIRIFKPEFVCIQSEKDIASLKEEFKNITVFTGLSGLNEIAKLPNNLLVIAIAGTISLVPTYQAIQNNTAIALASKEVLVSAGDIIMDLAKKKQLPILPIDSEHAAIKQCLASTNNDITKINRIILTASGGPFWDKDIKTTDISPETALKHPNWQMGPKISIDSATLMNKGLEIIEAHHLFSMPYEKIETVIHPQSIIHALVEFSDGNILAHMGPPDMRFPIQYAITFPEKLKSNWPKLSLAKLSGLKFYEPDTKKFPLLKLAIEAGIKGGNIPAVMNAANEAAVNLFLQSKIKFNDIEKIINQVLEKTTYKVNPTIQDIVEIDKEVKENIYARVN